MIDAIHFEKLNKIGYGNAHFSSSFRDMNENIELISPSGMTLTVLSQSGFICEESQAVESINLAEKGALTLTLGDYLLRMNGLLKSCIDDDKYELVECISSKRMLKYIYDVLCAVSLEERLLHQLGYYSWDNIEKLNEKENKIKIEIEELYVKLCKIVLTGLSGGEQQRLRLSSLFLIERIRYDVKYGRISSSPSPSSSSIIKDIESHPMQLLVLDEPDHHFDKDFFFVLSRLLSTLDLNHQENLTVIAVLHKELHKEILINSFQGELKSFSPKLRSLTMKSLGYVDRNDKEMESKYPLLREAFQQYDVIEERNKKDKKEKDSILAVSVSILEESNLF